jgi:hypothetical protein
LKDIRALNAAHIFSFDNTSGHVRVTGETRLMKKSMRLRVSPTWDEIEKVRNKSSTFLKSQGYSKDSVQSLTMVISELMENGIKYGRYSASGDKLLLNISIGEEIATVEVANPVDDRSYRDLKKLDKTIQWIRGYQDSFEAYVERLKEVSRKPLNDEESGLGLVRIAYEGKAILDFFVGEDDVVSVSAVTNSEID